MQGFSTNFIQGSTIEVANIVDSCLKNLLFGTI